MTARNCGVIAPGNHWIYDSLRGAPPPGEAMGASRQMVFCQSGRHPGRVSVQSDDENQGFGCFGSTRSLWLFPNR